MKRVGIFLLILTIQACGYSAPNYSVSADNVISLRTLSEDVSVATITAAKPGVASIGCRAAGPVKLPNGATFENYIRNAVISELTLAEKYSLESEIALEVHLVDSDFGSNIGSGHWTFEIDASVSGGETKSLTSKYEFSTAWSADKACQKVAQSLVPAVQKLISDMISIEGLLPKS